MPPRERATRAIALPGGDGVRESASFVPTPRVESPPSEGPLSLRDRFIALQLALGRTQRDVAATVGVSASVVSNLKRRQAFLDAIEQERQQLYPLLREVAVDRVIAHFDASAPRAAEVMTELMEEADTDTTRLKAATQVIDRSSACQRQQHESDARVVFNLDGEFLAAVSRMAAVTQNEHLVTAVRSLEQTAGDRGYGGQE